MDELYLSFCNDYSSLLKKDSYISKNECDSFLDEYKYLFESINMLSDSDIKKSTIKNITNNIANDIIKHNNDFIDRKLIEYKDYFDNLFKEIDPNILLDEEQRRAILINEDYSLVIAGAGSGKTTTMTAKVKYLIEKCNVSPDEILVMSFTDKAVEELNNRINDDFKLNINVKTFHSLGLQILNERLNVKVRPVNDGFKRQLFYDYFKEQIFPNKKALKYYLDNFTKYLHLSYEPLYYISFDEYYDNYIDCTYKKHVNDLKEYIEYRIQLREKSNITIRYEEVKSKAEVKIANFLYINNINYSYEKRYRNNEKDFSYYPDFTVTLQNGKNIYIEFYGLSQKGKYNNNLYSDKEVLEYQNLIKKKEILHKKYGTDLIELFPNDDTTDYLDVLKEELEKRGVFLIEKTDKEVFLKIMETSKNSQLINFVNMVCLFISRFKTNNFSEKDFDKLKNSTDNLLIKKQLIALRYLYCYYNETIHKEYMVDFEDMINLATLYIKKSQSTKKLINYRYIIIDEFQDISQQRFDLLQTISDFYNAKIIGVGDDWQAIFGFSGAKIDLFTNFCELMGYGEIIKITNTYRNSQELIDVAGEFVLKNSNQFIKKLHSPKHLLNPIEIIYYNEDDTLTVSNILECIILNIYNQSPNDKILLLGRYNDDKQKILCNKLFKEAVKSNNEIIYTKNPNIKLTFLTVHSSKGLGYDQVILINASNSSEDGFPSKIKDDPIISILKNSSCENIEYAEERRLFYVALTRTKNKMYILSPDNNVSSFVSEIVEYDNVIENKSYLDDIEII